MTPTKLTRQLRRNQTNAEQLLWLRVRSRQLGGLKFKRQFRIGRYIVDFFCHETRLVIELDGGQHAECAEYDHERSMKIQALGYRVLRFWNNDVLENIEGVLMSIMDAASGKSR